VVRLEVSLNTPVRLPTLESLRQVLFTLVDSSNYSKMDKLASSLLATTPDLDMEVSFHDAVGTMTSLRDEAKALFRSQALSQHGERVTKLSISAVGNLEIVFNISLARLARLQEVTLGGLHRLYRLHDVPPGLRRLRLESCEADCCEAQTLLGQELALVHCPNSMLELVGEGVRDLSITMGSRNSKYHIAELIKRLPLLKSLALVNTRGDSSEYLIVKALALVMPRLESLQLSLLELPEGPVYCPDLKTLGGLVRFPSQLPVAPLRTVDLDLQLHMQGSESLFPDTLRAWLRGTACGNLTLSLRASAQFPRGWALAIPQTVEHLVLDSSVMGPIPTAELIDRAPWLENLKTLRIKANNDLQELRRAFPNTVVTRTIKLY
jgi:hypothetical protein